MCRRNKKKKVKKFDTIGPSESAKRENSRCFSERASYTSSPRRRRWRRCNMSRVRSVDRARRILLGRPGTAPGSRGTEQITPDKNGWRPRGYKDRFPRSPPVRRSRVAVSGGGAYYNERPPGQSSELRRRRTGPTQYPNKIRARLSETRSRRSLVGRSGRTESGLSAADRALCSNASFWLYRQRPTAADRYTQCVP